MPNIMRHTLRIALIRCAKATSATGQQHKRITGGQALHQHFGIGKIILTLAALREDDLITHAGMTAIQTPGFAVHTIHLGIEIHRRTRHHHLLGAQSATETTRATGVLTQRMLFIQQRKLRFHLLDRIVVGITIVHADGGRHAIFIVLGTPATP